MAYEINEAKALVVEAGKKLVESGLIARTWGNVSARISDTQFVITPSGRAYETLTPDEIVVVNIADCEYEGDIKPSSEKGVHADAYKLRPDVDFIIHTHQVNASIISAAGIPIKDIPAKDAKVLGPIVPVGAYGMPSTGALREGVAAAVEANPESKAVIMKHHGALCMGASLDEAFKIAETLEALCAKEVGRLTEFACGKKYKPDNLYKAFATVFPGSGDAPVDLGSSKRISDELFELSMENGTHYVCTMQGVGKNGIAPRVALIHAAIYRNCKVKFIVPFASDDVKALSYGVDKLTPYLDDFAQIAGRDVKVCNWLRASYRTDADEIGKAAKGRSAIVIRGQGALCTGNSMFDIDAVKLVLEKECKTEMYSLIKSGVKSLSPIDCAIMRTIYVLKYSKQASK